MTTNDGKDVGFIEDAAFYLQNAIAAENHCHMSYILTKDVTFVNIADMIRKDRSRLLYSFVPESKAQIYCLAKHCMAMAMGMKEIANRYTDKKDIESAKECLESAGNYEAIFRLILMSTETKGGKKKNVGKETITATSTS